MFALLNDSFETDGGDTFDEFDVYFSGAHGDSVYTVEVQRVTPDLSGVDLENVVTFGN